MTPADILILLLLAGAVAAVLVLSRRRKKRCGAGCTGCTRCAALLQKKVPGTEKAEPPPDPASPSVSQPR